MLTSTHLDADNSHTISKCEFETLLLKPEAAIALDNIGVDVVGLVDMVDLIFEDDEELSFPDFIDLVLRLRGSNKATVRDVVNLRKYVQNEMRNVVQSVTEVVSSFSETIRDDSQKHGPVNSYRAEDAFNASINSDGCALKGVQSHPIIRRDETPANTLASHNPTGDLVVMSAATGTTCPFLGQYSSDLGFFTLANGAGAHPFVPNLT